MSIPQTVWIALAVVSACLMVWLLKGYYSGQLAITKRTILTRSEQPVAFALAMGANLLVSTALLVFIAFAVDART